MGNPEEFIKMVRHYQKVYAENKGSDDPDKYRDFKIAERNLARMESDYVFRTITKVGLAPFFEKIRDVLSDPQSGLASNFRAIISAGKDELPAGPTKTAVTKILEKHAGEKNAMSLYEDVKIFFVAGSATEDLKKFQAAVTRQAGNLFNSPDELGSAFNRITEEFPPTEDLVEEEEAYLSYYEKSPERPFHAKLKKLSDEEFEKENPDKELIKAYEDADLLMTDVGTDSFNYGLAESVASKVQVVFDKECDIYEAKVGMKYSSRGISALKTQQDVVNYYHSNKQPNVPQPSEKFIRKSLELIQYMRDHHLVVTDPNGPFESGFTRLSSVIMPSTRKLANAITNENKEDIKKYTAEAKEKTDAIDHVIREIKELDPKHYYIVNHSCAREPFYPGRYRTDYEGATLFNQLATISEVCTKSGMDPEVALINPGAVLDKVLGDITEGDSRYKSYFQTNDPLSLIENLETDELTPMSIPVTKAIADLERFAGSASINNPENKEAIYLDAVLTGECKRAAASRNTGNVFSVMENKKKLCEEVLPTMLVAGKDFDVFTMVNASEPKIDIKTMKLAAPFSLRNYIGKKYTWETMLDKLRNVAQNVAEYENSNNFNSYVTALTSLAATCSEVLCDKLPVKKELADRLVEANSGMNPMSRTELNSANAQLAFAECEATGFHGSTLKSAVTHIADLQKKYNSHFFLARWFKKDLKAQGAVLESMKDTLVKSGMDKKGLEKAILDMKNGHEDRADAFVENAKATFHYVKPAPAVANAPVNEEKQPIVVEEVKENEKVLADFEAEENKNPELNNPENNLK